MADIKNDPSELYDSDSTKKNDEMFESPDDAANSIDKNDNMKIDDEEYSQDAFEEKSGLFSKLRQKSKNRKKEKKDLENSYKDSYDIFDLESLLDEEEKAAGASSNSKSSGYETSSFNNDEISDINALLESVGIVPIGDDSENAVNENAVHENAGASYETAQKTRVIGDIASQQSASKVEPVSEKTKNFDAIKADLSDEPIRPRIDVSLEETEKPKSDIHDEGQLILDGYADEEGPSKISEEAVEAELKKTRRNLIDNFRVLAKNSSDKAILEHEPTGEAKQSLPDSLETEKGEDLFKAVERAGKKKKVSEFFKNGAKSIKAASQKARKKEQIQSASALVKIFKAQKKKRSLQSKILIGLAAVALILSFIASAYTPGGALDPLFGNGARIYTAISLVLMFAGSAVSFDIFKKGIETVSVFKADSTVLCMLLTVFVTVHHIAMLVTGMYPDTGMTLYSAYVLFALAVQAFSDKYALSANIKTISFMAKGGKLIGIQPIDNSADASALGHGISDDGEPRIFFGADVEIPSDIESILCTSRVDEKFYGYSATAILAVSFIYALALSISTKNASVFTSGLIGSICLCLPLMRAFVITALNKKVNKSLNAAVVAGLDVCEDIGKSNAVVFDTDDIFDGKISKFRRVPGSRMAVEDAIVYAASTLKKTKCILADGFDDFLKEAQIKLPDAEDVVYEERLGYSSWVAGRKVLVGNREMLIQHSVDAPTSEEEKAYSKGKSVMYVVVEGIIAATFIATYSVRAEVRRSIGKFNKTGLILMLNTGDPCLNEATVASRLGADIAAIKIISTNGSEIITQYRNNQSIRKENGLIAIKKQRNILPLVTAAHSMYSAERLSTIINIVAIVFSFLLMIACAALKVSTGFSVLTIIVLQLAWSAGAYFTGESRIR